MKSDSITTQFSVLSTYLFLVLITPELINESTGSLKVFFTVLLIFAMFKLFDSTNHMSFVPSNRNNYIHTNDIIKITCVIVFYLFGYLLVTML